MSQPLFQDPGQAFLEQGQEHIDSPFYDPNRALLERDVTQLQAPGILVNPNEISPDEWAKIPTDGGEYRTLVDVAGGIAMAYALLMVMNQKVIMLRARDFVTEFGSDNLKRQAMKLTGTYRGAWTYMAQPAFGKAMALGSTENLSYAEELDFGRVYAHQIFDYINDTSADALVAAYQNQLAQKWSPQVAWARAAQGYGLDSRGMSQYVKLLQEGEGREIVPSVAKDFVARALQKRGERIGYNESWRAQELGKTVVWLNQYKQGKLPPDTKREWLTAEDERVCPVCAPMDHVQVPITEQFELPDGNKIWAPGVHPNCRCSVKLSYAEFKHEYTGFGKRESDDTRREASADQPRSHGRFARRGGVRERQAEEVEAPQKVTQPTKVTPPTKAIPPAKAVAPTKATAPTKAAAPTKVTAPTKVAAPTKVTAPQKAPAPSRAEQQRARYFRPDKPVYAYANELNYLLGDAYAWRGDTNYDVGDVVDLDDLAKQTKTGKTRFALPAYTLVSPHELARGASERYGDIDAYDTWDRTDRTIYHRTSRDFYQSAVNHAGLIVNLGLDPDEIRQIYDMAGDHVAARTMDKATLRHTLLENVQREGDLRDAYLHYLEHVHPSLVPGSDELAALNYNLPRDPHTATVLVFDQGFRGGLLTREKGKDTAIVEGRYRVARTRLIPLKPTMGMDTPSNMAALKYVYLEPIT